MDFQGCRKLHGVIATQSVLSGERRRLGDQPGRHLDDAVLAGEIELEIATAVAASWGVIEPPRSRRVMAATLSASVIRTTNERMPGRRSG